MDKLFKKSFFNDASRRPAQSEKAGSPLLQTPTGPHPSSNSKQTATANTKLQSKGPSPLDRDSPPSQVKMKASTPSINNKATPPIPTGQQQQSSSQTPSPPQYQPSPYQQHSYQQTKPREHSAEHSTSSLGSNRNSIISLDNSSDDRQPATANPRPPVPKHHSNLSQTNLTTPSTNGTSGTNGSSSSKPKEKAGKKWEILASQVNTLNDSKNKLEQQLVGLRREKDQQCMDLQRQCDELQRMLRFKEDEYTKMQNNFHKHVRSIRATDDDLSTIHAKLTMLQAKASQLPMALRSSYQEGQWTEVLAYFGNRWPALKGTLDRLVQHDAKTGILVTTTTTNPSEAPTTYERKLDYPLVCLLVEKMVMEILVAHVFDSPVHLGLSVNHHYQALSTFMEHHQANDWSNKLRQQLCKLAVHANQEHQVGIAEAKSQVVHSLKAELDRIYQIAPEKLLPKITKLVDLAAETSLAMHGQDNSVLFGTDLVEGQTMYNPRLMNLQFGSTLASPAGKCGGNTIKTTTPENSSRLHDDEEQQQTDTKDQDGDDDDEDEDDEDDRDEDEDGDHAFIEAPTSPLPIPSLILRVVVSPVVYAGDENGISTPLLPARVICF